MVSLTKKQQAEKDDQADAARYMEEWLAGLRARSIKTRREARMKAAIQVMLLGFQNAVYAIIAVWLVRHW